MEQLSDRMQNWWRLSLAAIVLLGFLNACGKPPAPEDVVVARIGDGFITAQEFKLTYEFGHGHLRRGENARRDVLDFMIREELLAQAAQELGLDTTFAVRTGMETLTEELLIEQVFQENVLDGIEVTEAEIRNEINRAAVSFQFRLMPATSEQDAWDAHDAILATGWDSELEVRKSRYSEIQRYEQELTSPIVRAEDIDPALLDIIQNLELNSPSAPAQFNGQWYVFQVTDIRRERLSDYDYAAKEPTYRKIIYNRKAMDGGMQFVAKTMEPLGVTTRRSGFEVLNEALWSWYSDNTPQRNLLTYLESTSFDTAYADLLRSNYEIQLVEFRNESWSVREFLVQFNPGRYMLRATDPVSFKTRLADVVALVVRDKILLEQADAANMILNPIVQRTLLRWKNKWLFEAFRNHKTAGFPVGVSRHQMISISDSLKTETVVKVYEAVLDTLDLSTAGSTQYATVHLLKNNSNKMPFPIVDANWKLKAN